MCCALQPAAKPGTIQCPGHVRVVTACPCLPPNRITNGGRSKPIRPGGNAGERHSGAGGCWMGCIRCDVRAGPTKVASRRRTAVTSLGAYRPTRVDSRARTRGEMTHLRERPQPERPGVGVRLRARWRWAVNRGCADWRRCDACRDRRPGSTLSRRRSSREESFSGYLLTARACRSKPQV